MKYNPCHFASHSNVLKIIAANLLRKMASTADSLECVICNESLLDPRPLPCGHSYCGPPRLCLTSLVNGEGGLRCAVCRTDHNLRAEEVKPLYGIRDFIQESSKAQVDDSSRLPCTAHPNKEFTLWCSTCGVMVCDDCIEYEHDDHSIRKLKRYLAKKIEEQLGLPLQEGLSVYRKNLASAIVLKTSELEHSKLHAASCESELITMLGQQMLLDQYNEFLNTDAASETCLLLKIMNSDLKKNGRCLNNQVTKNNAPNAALSKASVVSVSTETSSSSTTSSTQTGEFSNRTSGAVSSQTEYLNDPAQDIVVCKCGSKHKLIPPWNSRIAVIFSLLVLERNPFRTAPCSFLICCPFRFSFHTNLANRDNHGRDKFFRVTVACAELYTTKVPAFDFNYILFLVHKQDSKKNKSQTGKWAYPKAKQIFWDTILYSELVNPQSGWIGDDDCLEIQFRLTP